MEPPAPSTAQMQNRVGLPGSPVEHRDRLRGRQNNQLDLPAFGLMPYFGRHRQLPMRARADDQLAAFPGDLLQQRQGRVAERVAEFLGRLLVAFPHLAAINDDIVLVGARVNLDRAE